MSRSNTNQNELIVGNLGEPIRLTDINVHGVTARASRKDELAEIWTRLVMTSDDRNFHRIVENLSSVIEHCARTASEAVSLRNAHTIFLVMHRDNSAELWIDTAAVASHVMIKRDMQAGSVVFENDIADITGMDFPLVEIRPTDRVVCLFRQDWRFALFFDFNPDGDFDRSRMIKDLGTLQRTLRYRHLYDVLVDQSLFEKLVSAGWFPFVEVISEFKRLSNAAEAGFDLADAEAEICAKFTRERLDAMFIRWMGKPHFQGKEQLLRAAMNAFLSEEPIAVIKIALTEIEGILFEAYKAKHGRGAKIKRLLAFAVESAEAKAGSPSTLLFPRAFAHYLERHTFADFDPVGPRGQAGSRHAVGHGAAEAGSYTKTRALQALLTLDQISFYT